MKLLRVSHGSRNRLNHWLLPGAWLLWSMALQALRGVSIIVAATIIAELGDLRDSNIPESSWHILVLSRQSTQAAGKDNGRHYQNRQWARPQSAGGSQPILQPSGTGLAPSLKRQEDLSQEVRELAWKCQVRLCARFRRLMAKGKNRNTVVTAIARELAAFMWAIAIKTPISLIRYLKEQIRQKYVIAGAFPA